MMVAGRAVFSVTPVLKYWTVVGDGDGQSVIAQAQSFDVRYCGLGPTKVM